MNILYSKLENEEIDKLAHAIVSEQDYNLAKILATHIIQLGETRKQKEIKRVLGII